MIHIKLLLTIQKSAVSLNPEAHNRAGSSARYGEIYFTAKDAIHKISASSSIRRLHAYPMPYVKMGWKTALSLRNVQFDVSLYPTRENYGQDYDKRHADCEK